MLYIVYKLPSLLISTYFIYVVFIILCVAFLWNYIRKLYHLSKVPGPKGWPIIGHAFLIRKITQDETYGNLFEKHGNFFKLWIGPIPAVLVCEPDYIQTLLTSSKTMDKGYLFQIITRPVFMDSIIITDVEKWKRNRKICNYGFSRTILNSFLPIFNEISATLIEQLKQEVGKTEPFNAYAYFRRATLDSICGTAMGINLNNLQLTKNPYAQAVDNVLTTMIRRLENVWLYPDCVFKSTTLGKIQTDGMKLIWDTTNRVFHTKLQSMENNNVVNNFTNLNQPIEKNPLKKPLLDFLLDLTKVNPEFTVEQLKEEINLIILAGYETTAVSLSYILLVLAARKDIQQKVYNEIYSIFGDSDRQFQLEDLSKLEYLEMVIKEALRLYPPAAHILREASEDLQLGDYVIPAGTNILISILRTHRNPQYWPKPLEFIPERFSENRHPYAFIPFSGGPRNCIGGKYAIMFMKVQLVNILRKFEVHTNLKLEELRFELDISLKLVGEHLISVTERPKTIQNF